MWGMLTGIAIEAFGSIERILSYWCGHGPTDTRVLRNQQTAWVRECFIMYMYVKTN